MFKTEMSDILGNICRVCLKVAEKEFQIDETVNQMFEILLIKLDLSITTNPIICQHCMEVGKKCLSFKCTCIDTEKVILSFSAYKKEVKHSIKVIYEERNHRRLVFDDVNICRICMTRLERNNFVSVDGSFNGTTFEMLPKYMVEVDFNTIEKPIICANCKENLNVYFKFVLNCVHIEEKIKAFCVERGTDRTDEMRLGDVLQFMLTDVLEYPDKCSQTHKIKQGHAECTYPQAYSGLVKQEILYIKEERTIFNENTSELTDETKESENIKMVSQMDTRDFETDISADKGIFPMFKCSLCAYESKYKCNFKMHTLVHKDVSEINMFKCSLCTYEAKHKASLNYHMLVHKSVSEIKIFKCSLCTFECKRKSSLNSHIMTHKAVSEIKMFKCPLCAYEYKHKGSLKFHMLVHKDVSEINMFKCSLCTYETKRKGDFNSHMVIHKDISEIEMFKCSFCAYETRQKSNLRSHMVVHRDVSEINMFKCSLCAYESKYKGNLKHHMVVHKDVSEIKIFKCSLCDFQSKLKGNLTKHIIIHKDVSEINMFKCKLCSYESKQKRNLRRHILIHKGISEVK